MKKILIGCGVVFLLVCLAGGFAVWKAVSMFQGIAQELETAQENYKATNNEFAFTEPEDGLISAQRMDDWLDVQESLTDQAESIKPDDPSKVDGMKMVSEMLHFLPNLAKVHVEALRDSQMSFKEFGWIENQVVVALESDMALEDPDTAKMARTWMRSPATNPAFPQGFPPPNSNPFGSIARAPVNDEQTSHTLRLLKERNEKVIEAMPGIKIGSAVTLFTQ